MNALRSAFQSVPRKARWRLWLAGLATFLLLPAGGVLVPVNASSTPAPAGIVASGAVIIDGTSRAMLWGKAAETPRPMASTTKIMTALTVLATPGLDLKRVVIIKQAYRDYVVSHGYSSAGLVVGDRVTVRQLLYAMLLPSGCDAAYALADTFGTGSTVGARIKDFVARMNARATQLALAGTKFASFDGNSSAASHYITPRSLAVLTSVALSNPTFAAVVATSSTSQVARTSTDGARTYTWTNSNRLLGSYFGALGVKTGTSGPAGYCLVFAARRNGVVVVGVVLGDADDGSRYGDARRMLDWAFG